jgi:predicted dinucleotide-binding enzyme
MYASTPVKGGVNKIAVLGSGEVAQTLAKGFKDVGHDVIIGARPRQPSPTMRFERDSKERAALFAETGIPESNFETAVEGAEVVVLAFKGLIAEEVVESLSSALAHPLGVAVFLVIQWSALIRRTLGLQTSWRGRTLAPQ